MSDALHEYRKLYGKTLGLVREYNALNSSSLIYIDGFTSHPGDYFILSGSQVLVDETPVVFTSNIGGVTVGTIYYIFNATDNPTTTFKITANRGTTPVALSGTSSTGTMVYNTTQYLIDLKRVISEQLTTLQSLLWGTLGFLQDPSFYLDNFEKSEQRKLFKYLTNYTPQWGGFGYNSAHTSRTIFTKLNTSPDGQTFFSGSNPTGMLAIGSSGVVYIPVQGGIWAQNPDGTTKWVKQLYGNINSSPAIGYDETIYVGTSTTLYAFNNLSVNNLVWSKTTVTIQSVDININITTSPVIGPDGKIYVVNSTDNSLLIFNQNGTLASSFVCGGPVTSSPAIGYDGTVYVVSNISTIGQIQAIRDGAQVWNTSDVNLIPGELPTPVIKNILTSVSIGSDGTIYCGDSHDNFYAICGNDGIIIASYTIGSGFDAIRCTPAIGDDGTVYVTMPDKIYAFKLKVNTTSPYGSIFTNINASFSTGGSNMSDSLVIGGDGNVYVGLSNGHIQPFDRTLHPLTILTGGTLPLRGPVIGADQRLYAYNTSGVVYVFS